MRASLLQAAAEATAAKVLDENVLKSTQGMRLGDSSHLSITPDLKPPSRMKRKRIVLNAPGPLHQEWQKTRELKEARASEVQGLSEAGAEEHCLEEGICTGFGEAREGVVFRPLRRFADSLRNRLAPMARWEAWLRTEGCHTEDNVCAPEDVLLGKFLLSVSQGGPTSAAAVWGHLQ